MARRIYIQSLCRVPLDTPVKERMTYPLHTELLKCDVAKAKRGSYTACALALSAMRTCGVPGAVVLTRRVYVPQRDKKGKLFIGVWHIPDSEHRELVEFDRTGRMPEHGVTFQPLPENMTSAGRRMFAQTDPAHNRKDKTAPKKRRKPPAYVRIVPKNLIVTAHRYND